MVDELIVECPYRDAGCRHACQRYLLDTHLRVECGYTQIPCPSGGCDRTLLRKDVSMHQCIPRTEICDSCGCAVDAEDEQVSSVYTMNLSSGLNLSWLDPSAHVHCHYVSLRDMRHISTQRPLQRPPHDLSHRHRRLPPRILWVCLVWFAGNARVFS